METYNAVIKIKTDNEDRFLKYRGINNLVKFTEFLDRNFPNWKYFNIYDHKSKSYLKSFTINNKPKTPKIQY